MKRQFSGLPSFGLFATLVFVVLWLPMRLIDAYVFDSFHSRGIYVRSARLASQTVPWSKPLIVRVVDSGPQVAPKLYLNDQPVSWDALAKAVQREIGRPADQTVYIEGDENVAWQDMLNAMDIIRGLRCKVVLLTRDSPKAPAR